MHSIRMNGETISGYHFIDLTPYNDLLIGRVNNGIVLYDISNRLNPLFKTYCKLTGIYQEILYMIALFLSAEILQHKFI